MTFLRLMTTADREMSHLALSLDLPIEFPFPLLLPDPKTPTLSLEPGAAGTAMTLAAKTETRATMMEERMVVCLVVCCVVCEVVKVVAELKRFVC